MEIILKHLTVQEQRELVGDIIEGVTNDDTRRQVIIDNVVGELRENREN